MASSSKPSRRPSAVGTPAPSSPPPSESYFSEVDGTAPSVLETSADFNWDPSKAESIGLNLVSWRKGVDEDEVEDDLATRGFYAISTVLNHPTKKANPLRSTRKPLPPIQPPLALAKPPPSSHYEAYLKSVTPLYETFLNARSVGSGDASQPPLTGAFDSGPLSSDQPGSSSVSGSASLPPLEAIPEVFFHSTFNLADPDTWSAVTGSTDRERNLKRSTVQTQQDDLSSHLDTLERHLIHEITLRSTSFFSALSNLQDLHSESSSCLDRIRDLQTGLKEIGLKTAKRGLELVDKHEDLRVLRATEQGLEEIKELEELLEVTKTVVDSGDWAGGLACLGDVQVWWERHLPRPAHLDTGAQFQSHVSNANGTATIETSHEGAADMDIPLGTLPALAPLPQLFKDVTTQLALQLETALHSYLLSTVSAAELEEEAPYDNERFRDHVLPMVRGLERCGTVDGVEGVWRDVVTLAVREGSRKHLPVAHDDDAVESSAPGQEMRGANLAQALKSMDHKQYLSLSTSMNHTMLSRLRLINRINTDLSGILSASSSPTSSSTPLHLVRPSTVGITIDISTQPQAGTGTNPLDSIDILAGACDLANLRASKILGVRGDQHAALKIEEFVEVFKVNWEFIERTEELGGRVVPSLRGVTAAQARTFLIAYHSSRLTKSAKLVEEEQWSQVDVSKETQHAVGLLIESATNDPAECFVPPRPLITDQQASNGNGASVGNNKMLHVESNKFFVVKATAESLELLSEYLRVVVNLEVVVTDAMGRIIEFLKSFNSRTCQVVLGAGAMRSAGLKNITAKHLALASQSLSVIVALIPYIREAIRRHLGPKQAVMLTEFDKLKRDYQEHQNEIHAKLVAIMSDRLAVHCGSLRDIDWEATPDKDAPRGYAEMLVKETATLHKVLSKYLAESTVESVMSEVLAAIVHRLSEEYTKIELKSEEAKKRMMQDVQLVSTRLQPLSSSGASVTSLETLVRDKHVPKKNVLGNLLKRGGSGSKGKAQGAKGEDGSVANGETGDDEDEDGAIDELGDEDARDEDENGAKKEQVDIAAEPGRGDQEPGDGVSGEMRPTVESGGGITTDSAVPIPVEADGTKTSTEQVPKTEPEVDSTVVATPNSDGPPAPPSKDEINLSASEISHSNPSDSIAVSDSRASIDAPDQAPIPPAKPTSTPPPLATPQPIRIASPSPANMLSSPPPSTFPFNPSTLATSTPTAPGPTGSPVSITSLRSPPPNTNNAAQAAAAISPVQSTPTRAPRISLANRLKGVMSRTGSTEPASPSGSIGGLPSPVASPVRDLHSHAHAQSHSHSHAGAGAGAGATAPARSSIESGTIIGGVARGDQGEKAERISENKALGEARHSEELDAFGHPDVGPVLSALQETARTVPEPATETTQEDAVVLPDPSIPTEGTTGSSEAVVTTVISGDSSELPVPDAEAVVGVTDASPAVNAAAPEAAPLPSLPMESDGSPPNEGTAGGSDSAVIPSSSAATATAVTEADTNTISGAPPQADPAPEPIEEQPQGELKAETEVQMDREASETSGEAAVAAAVAGGPRIGGGSGTHTEEPVDTSEQKGFGLGSGPGRSTISPDSEPRLVSGNPEQKSPG